MEHASTLSNSVLFLDLAVVTKKCLSWNTSLPHILFCIIFYINGFFKIVFTKYIITLVVWWRIDFGFQQNKIRTKKVRQEASEETGEVRVFM